MIFEVSSKPMTATPSGLKSLIWSISALKRLGVRVVDDRLDLVGGNATGLKVLLGVRGQARAVPGRWSARMETRCTPSAAIVCASAWLCSVSGGAVRTVHPWSCSR